MTETLTISVKDTDKKCIAAFKQRHKGNVSREIAKLIRRELNEHPERYQ